MAENNQYPDNQHGTFAPVGIILIVAIAAVLAVFVYGRAYQDDAPPAPSPAAANPAAPVVPGTDIPADPQPQR